MLVSEQATEKVGLADYGPGASTFPGEPVSGGWIPVLLKIDEFTRPSIIDWICPNCNRLLANSRTCPRCGLGLKVSPRTFDPLPFRSKVQQYKEWAGNAFGARNRDADGIEAIEQADNQVRSRKSPGHRIKHKHSLAKSQKNTK